MNVSKAFQLNWADLVWNSWQVAEQVKQSRWKFFPQLKKVKRKFLFQSWWIAINTSTESLPFHASVRSSRLAIFQLFNQLRDSSSSKWFRSPILSCGNDKMNTETHPRLTPLISFSTQFPCCAAREAKIYSATANCLRKNFAARWKIASHPPAKVFSFSRAANFFLFLFIGVEICKLCKLVNSKYNKTENFPRADRVSVHLLSFLFPVSRMRPSKCRRSLCELELAKNCCNYLNALFPPPNCCEDASR